MSGIAICGVIITGMLVVEYVLDIMDNKELNKSWKKEEEDVH